MKSCFRTEFLMIRWRLEKHSWTPDLSMDLKTVMEIIIKSEDGQEIADFTTSSIFQPYVTTVGLYNEANELLVVGKLGQPIRTAQETDTTFILRWDT